MATPDRSLLRHPDFLKLWTAETISVFGSAITLLALPLIAATVLQVGAFEFGLLTTIEFLPFRPAPACPRGSGWTGCAAGRS